MRGRRLIILAVITAAVIATAIVVARYRAPRESAGKPLLLPEFAARVNDVAQIRIEGKGQALTLEKKNDAWVISEADGYPALFERVKETVVAVADLRLVAQKTSNPELFDRLGVEDPAGKSANSVLLTLSEGGGSRLAALIIGKERISAAAGDSPGLYVRLPDSQQALLVQGRLNVSVRRSDWIGRDLFDIRSERVQEISIDHGDGAPMRLHRENPDADLTLAEIPEGKEVKSPIMVTRVGTVLENFFIDGARAEENVIFPATPTTVTVKTRDGLVAVMAAAQIEGTPMAKLSFAYEPPPEPAAGTAAAGAENAPEAPAAAPAGSTEKAGEPPPAAAPDEKQEKGTDVAAEVAKLQTAVAGWVFEIPEFKFELLSRRMDELIRDPADKTEEPVAPPDLPE